MAAADAAGPQGPGELLPAAQLLELPNAVLHEIGQWLDLQDCANCLLVGRRVAEVAKGTLSSRAAWQSHSGAGAEASHLKTAKLFRFLSRHCPRLEHVSCHYSSDKLYGGSLLQSSLTGLAAACPRLRSLTLLNVDVNDAVLLSIGAHCSGLQHLALGRTEDNAFGCMASDEGMRQLVGSCTALASLALFRCYAVGDVSLRTLGRFAKRLRRLVLHNCPQVTSGGMIALAEGATQLTALDVLAADHALGSSCLDYDSCFALAANCSNLQVLRVSEELLRFSVLDDEALALLARGCALTQMELVQVEAGDALLTAVAQHCRGLQVLRLEQTYAGDEGVEKVVRSCRQLRELRVAGCSPHCWMLPTELMFPGMTEAGLEAVCRHATALTSLDLSGLAAAPAPAPAGNGVSFANALPTPAPSGRMAGSSGGAGLLPWVGHASSGAWHSIGHSPHSAGAHSGGSSMRPFDHAGADVAVGPSEGRAPEFTLADFAAAAGAPPPPPLLAPLLCSRLTRLCLDWLKVDGAGWQAHLEQALAASSGLAELSLVGCPVDVDQLLAAAAAAAPPLRALNLQHTGVTDAGLAQLGASFPRLNSLQLSYCRSITDAGLRELAALMQLQSLCVYNAPKVSEQGIGHLAAASPSLQHLYVGHHTGAARAGTREGLAQLAEERRKAGGCRVQLLKRHPGAESQFESSTVRAVLQLQGGSAAWGCPGLRA